MRRFSRWMPPKTRQKLRLRDHAVLLTLLLLLMWGTLASASFRFAVASLGVITVILQLWNRRRLRLLTAERPSEDIGTFARAFDRHDPAFDPWVVRAIWDALQAYVHVRGATPALRPDDRLDDIVRIDPEDLWDIVLPEAAQRTGRSLEHIRSNPKYGNVETVGDLVRLLALQPKRESA